MNHNLIFYLVDIAFVLSIIMVLGYAVNSLLEWLNL